MLAVEGLHLDAAALGEERRSRRVIRREGNGEGGWREGETDGEGDNERTHRSQTVGGEAGPHDTSSVSSNRGRKAPDRTEAAIIDGVLSLSIALRARNSSTEVSPFRPLFALSEQQPAEVIPVLRERRSTPTPDPCRRAPRSRARSRSTRRPARGRPGGGRGRCRGRLRSLPRASHAGGAAAGRARPRRARADSRKPSAPAAWRRRRDRGGRASGTG